MENRDFDRMLNPLDVQAGLDELSGFVPDDAYLALKASCSNACLVMNLQRTHHYSIKELKELTDRYADLAHRADSLLRIYSANDAFVFRFMDLCERYAELEGYLQIVKPLLAKWNEMEHITSVDVFDQWKNCYSAMYEKTYFVTEFLNFRNSYESIREASWFLEFDTKMAKRAIYDYHDLHVAENLSSPYWRYRYTDLYERIRENLGLYYLTGGHSEDYLYVFGFKIVKMELKVLLEFVELMADYHHQILKLHLKIDR